MVSGTIYLRARYYNADLGRFTQQDGWEFANPEEPLSLNLYTYCYNSPVLYVDPTGHFINTIICGVTGAIVGGVRGLFRGKDAGACSDENKNVESNSVVHENIFCLFVYELRFCSWLCDICLF